MRIANRLSPFVIAAITLVAAACGSDSPAGGGASSAGGSTTVSAGSTSVGASSGGGSTTLGSPSSSVARDAQPLAKSKKIVFSAVPGAVNIAAYVAQAKGYFAAENLDVEITNLGPGPTVLPLLATGKADVAYTAGSPAFFNGIASGLDVRCVADVSDPRPGAPAATLVTKKDGPIKQLSDLRGQKIGSQGGYGAAPGFFVSELLKQAGMTLDDVAPLVDLTVPDGVAAMEQGGVAAAVVSQPLLGQLIKAGTHVMLGDIEKVTANGLPTCIMFGPNLLKDDRQAGVAFLRALMKASRTNLQGDYLQDPTIADILAKATGSTGTITADQTPVVSKDLTMLSGTLVAQGEYFLARKYLSFSTPLQADAFVDTTLLKLAQDSYK